MESVEDIKNEIYGKHMPAQIKRVNESDPKDLESEITKLEQEISDYKRELEHLKTRNKEMFRETNRLKEYVADLEERIFKGGKAEPETKKEAGWQKLLWKGKEE